MAAKAPPGPEQAKNTHTPDALLGVDFESSTTLPRDDELSQLHAAYLREREFATQVSPATLRSEKTSFSLLMKLVPGTSLEILEPRTMAMFFERLAKRPRQIGKGEVKSGVKPATVLTHRRNLKKFCDWLVARGRLQRDAFAGIRAPSLRYADRKYLARQEVERLLTALLLCKWRSPLVKHRNIAIFMLLLFCGLRKGELLALKVHDVDLKNRILVVRGETSKSRRQRVVPLHSAAAAAIQEYFKERGASFRTPHVFVSNNRDDGIGEEGLKQLVAKLRKSSGVAFHVHQLRHTFAVNLLNSGCDVSKVRALLGHTDIRQTVLYLRCLPAKATRSDIEQVSFDRLL